VENKTDIMQNVMN